MTNWIERAQDVLQQEADAIIRIKAFINEDFVKSIYLIKESQGRLVVTGIGKSAIIAQKLVATFNSTGTPAIFMHAADAIHGDLGIIQPEDVVLCLSKSGNTPEISVLVPFFKMRGNKLIALVGNTDSYLAKEGDDARIYNQLGLCEMKKGEYVNALAAFQAGLQVEGNVMTQSLLFNEIAAYEYLGDFAQAKTLINKYLTMYPDDAEAVREAAFLGTR